MGGAGIVLEINGFHSFSLKLGCGYNTNSRAELLALWSLLFLAEKIGIPTLYISGDSSTRQIKKNPSLSLIWNDGVIKSQS